MSETDKISEMQEAVAHLIDEASALEEKMLWNFEEVNKKLDHITGVVENLARPMVAEAKAAPTQAKREDAKILGDSPPTLFEALKAANLNVDDLDALPDGTVKTKRFLGDIWGQYNAVFEGFGYKWVKGVGWGKSGAAPTPTPAPQPTQPTPQTGNTVEGVVKDIGPPREAKTGRGPVKVQDFTLSTPGGDVRVSIWAGVLPPSMLVGKSVRVQGVKPGTPYKGTAQWSGNDKTTYTIS